MSRRGGGSGPIPLTSRGMGAITPFIRGEAMSKRFALGAVIPIVWLAGCGAADPSAPPAAVPAPAAPQAGEPAWEDTVDAEPPRSRPEHTGSSPKRGAYFWAPGYWRK